MWYCVSFDSTFVRIVFNKRRILIITLKGGTIMIRKIVSLFTVIAMMLGICMMANVNVKAADRKLTEIRITADNTVSHDPDGYDYVRCISAVATFNDGKQYTLTPLSDNPSSLSYSEEKSKFGIGAEVSRWGGQGWVVMVNANTDLSTATSMDWIYYSSSSTKCYVNGKELSYKEDQYGTVYYNLDLANLPAPNTGTTPAPGPATTPAVSFKQGAEGSVYRLLNPNNNEHLYTTDVNECKTLISQGWKQEETSGISAKSGIGVYRLYNKNSGEHLYTADTNELKVLTAQGWSQDNNGKPLFYGSTEGKTPVYRLFNAAAPQIASHHYTSDQNEIKVLTGQGWVMDNDGKPVYALQ